MRNANNGGTNLGDLEIDKADNFIARGNSYIVDIGEVKGLGNVAYIPRKGWADRVSVVPGHGYIMGSYDYATGESTFTRFYVIDWMTAAVTGGIIGAEIKYQKPFSGLDESLRLESRKVTIPAEGGMVSVMTGNRYFTPFSVKSEGELKCRVSRGSSTDIHFIHDGIAIECDESFATEELTATVTVTTAYGRTETIEVTQTPRGEFIDVGADEVEIAMEGADNSPVLAVFTNIEPDAISVASSEDWLGASLTGVAAKSLARKFKSIEGKAVEAESRGNHMQEISLYLSAGVNTDANSREATVTLSHGDIERNVSVRQAGISTMPEFNDMEFDAQSHNSYIDFVPGGLRGKITLEVEAEAADWCTAKINGTDSRIQVSLAANRSIQPRKAEVTAYAFGEKCGSFTITQKGIENMPVLNECYIIPATGKSLVFSFNPGGFANSELAVRSTNDYFDVKISSNTITVTTKAKNYLDKTIDGQIEVLCEGKTIARSRIEHEARSYSVRKLYAPKSGGTFQHSFSDADFPYTPKCDKSFVTAQIINGDICLRLSETTENRSATVSFDELNLTIEVKQTIYAFGNQITVNGLNCTVLQIAQGFYDNDSEVEAGYLCHKIEGQYAWSTETAHLGLVGTGIVNMRKVMSIPNWENLYPAFAAVNALNSNGELIWFLPSYREIWRMPYFPYSWLSSEADATHAHHKSEIGTGYDTMPKTSKSNVVAMRTYDFFAE